MDFRVKWFTSIGITTALGLALFAQGLNAQAPTTNSRATPDAPSPSNDGWHVDLVPYVWFAGVHGTTGVLGHEVSIHADASDVLSYLNIGVMGHAEIRHNRFLIPVDFMWIKLTDNKALPFDVGVTSVKAEFRQTIFTPGIGYRWVDHKKFTVDGYMGVRYWHLYGSLKLQPPVLNINSSASGDWVDGIAGGKLNVLVSPKVVLTIGGDGGGGTARSDYQAYGVLGFRVSQKWLLQAGYRYASVNYRPSNTFVYDVSQSGLIIGATWSVK